MTEKLKKRMEWLVPAGMVMLVGIVCMCTGGFYFSSNDDALLADILSGAYSGKPDAHDIYHLYPLSFLLSLLYKIAPAVPWYGGFLILAQLVCLYLVGRRCMEFAQNLLGKTAAAAAGILFCAALLMSELRLLQYTMTSGILAATAVFLLVTDTKKRYAAVIVLYTAAFLLRMQMGLLLLPFFFVACFFRWLGSGEKKRAFWQYLSVTGILLGTLAACYLIHAIAYGSSEWKEFEDFNQVRTQIYDYGGRLPEYESHAEFYEENGISEAERALWEYYAFSFSDSWNGEALETIGAYQREIKSYQYTWLYVKKILKILLEEYIVDFSTYYGVVLTVPAVIFLLGGIRKKELLRIVTVFPAFLAAHMVCMGYLLWNNRMPERVTNGLYLTEAALLVGMCVTQNVQSDRETGRFQRLCPRMLCGVLTVLSVVGFAGKLPEEHVKNVGTEQRTHACETIEKYCMSHTENMYIMDAYSAAGFGRKIRQEQSAENFLLCGAWTTNSPLYGQKLAKQLGADSLERGLSSGRMCFIIEKGRDIGWLENYLAPKGFCLQFQEELVTGTGTDYTVYQVTAQQGGKES